MKKHLAVFVSDGSELVGIHKEEKNDRAGLEDFCWEEFDWFFDHFFMSVVNQLLEMQSPAKVTFGVKQLPREWIGARHFVISFEKFMLITNNVLKSRPPLEDMDKDFRCFYERCLQDSYERVRNLKEDVKGLYKMLPDDLYVLFLIKPVTPIETTMEHLYLEWERRVPKIEDLLKDILSVKDQK